MRLLVAGCPEIDLNGKLNPRLSWVFETSSLDSFTANKIILSRLLTSTLAELVDKIRKEIVKTVIKMI